MLLLNMSDEIMMKEMDISGVEDDGTEAQSRGAQLMLALGSWREPMATDEQIPSVAFGDSCCISDMLSSMRVDFRTYFLHESFCS